MITINKTDNYKISDHFNIREYFSKSRGVTSHPLDERLFTIMEYLRVRFDKPIKITSSFRSKLHQISLTGSERSAHCLGLAVDFQCLYKEDNRIFIDSIAEMVIKGDKLFMEKLQSMGVGGIGLYDNFIHIDVRTPETYNYGQTINGKLLAIWNKRIYPLWYGHLTEEEQKKSENEIKMANVVSMKEDAPKVKAWHLGVAVLLFYYMFKRKWRK